MRWRITPRWKQLQGFSVISGLSEQRAIRDPHYRPRHCQKKRLIGKSLMDENDIRMYANMCV